MTNLYLETAMRLIEEGRAPSEGISAYAQISIAISLQRIAEALERDRSAPGEPPTVGSLLRKMEASMSERTGTVPPLAVDSPMGDGGGSRCLKGGWFGDTPPETVPLCGYQENHDGPHSWISPVGDVVSRPFSQAQVNNSLQILANLCDHHRRAKLPLPASVLCDECTKEQGAPKGLPVINEELCALCGFASSEPFHDSKYGSHEFIGAKEGDK